VKKEVTLDFLNNSTKIALLDLKLTLLNLCFGQKFS